MASLFGHAASVIGMKKLFPDKKTGRKVLVLGIISAILPDLDVLGHRFGISAYSNFDYLAHRGFTHSIIFGAIWSLIILFLFHKKDNNKLILLGIFYFLCTASHGLLDSMTNGGDGITFFLPFSTERYFFPFRFIEVSPLGAKAFFSEWGLKVLWSEFKYIGIPSILLYLCGSVLNKKVYS